jgi:AcrR family transcriptional regulator
VSVRQRQTKNIRQQQIITAVKRLIVQYGSEHVTIRKLAKEIGVTEGTIYRHFNSKKQILYLLLDDIDNSLTFESDGDDLNSPEPLVFLQQALLNQLSITEQKKGISFQVIAEIISLGDSQLNKKAYRVVNNFLFRVKQNLSKAVQSGDIRQDVDQETIAVLLFGMMQGLVTLWALNHKAIYLEQNFRNQWNLVHKSISLCLTVT